MVICGALFRRKARQANRLLRRRPDPSVIGIGHDHQSWRGRSGTRPGLATPEVQLCALLDQWAGGERCFDRGLLTLRFELVFGLVIVARYRMGSQGGRSLLRSG
jgi:hypothetical protein